MKRFLLIAGLLLAVMFVGYLLGPTAHSDTIKHEPIVLDPDLVKLEQSIATSEKKANLRPDNEARIIWADSLQKVKTAYSLVYLPGFRLAGLKETLYTANLPNDLAVTYTWRERPDMELTRPMRLKPLHRLNTPTLPNGHSPSEKHWAIK